MTGKQAMKKQSPYCKIFVISSIKANIKDFILNIADNKVRHMNKFFERYKIVDLTEL